MGLNIKNKDVEQLARQVAQATGESKTEAIRIALMERRDRLGLRPIAQTMHELEKVLRELHRGRTFDPVTKEEWDRLNEYW
jgi:hypothetical protein